MKFVVDEQLPPLLATRLTQWGHESIHVFDTPSGKSGADLDVRAFADATGRTVISKDEDFLRSHVAFASPAALLYATFGNLKTNPLLTLFESHLPVLLAALTAGGFADLGPDGPVPGPPVVPPGRK